MVAGRTPIGIIDLEIEHFAFMTAKRQVVLEPEHIASGGFQDTGAKILDYCGGTCSTYGISKRRFELRVPMI